MSHKRLHLMMMAVWLLLLIPSITLWRNSLVWVVLMSWYANFVGHWSSYQAARAEESNGKSCPKTAI